MLKYFILILMSTLTGCAYTSRDTYLNPVDSAAWGKTTDTSTDTQLLTYQCGKNEITVRIRQTLEADSSTYLMFFVVPVGNADLFDKEYDGVYVTYNYGKLSKPSDCLGKKIQLVSNGTTYKPKEAREIRLDKETPSCSVRWDAPINTSGEFSIVLPETEVCEVPQINFTYKTGNKYKHDRMNP